MLSIAPGPAYNKTRSSNEFSRIRIGWYLGCNHGINVSVCGESTLVDPKIEWIVNLEETGN